MRLKHLLLTLVATAAVLPAAADVHPRYTTVVSDATSTYVTKRPPAEERLFVSAIIEKRPWLIDCVRDMRDLAEDFRAEWVCAGSCSKAGHPHHPLYLRKDERFRPFDLGGYLT